jgi:hypothetical protein
VRKYGYINIENLRMELIVKIFRRNKASEKITKLHIYLFLSSRLSLALTSASIASLISSRDILPLSLEGVMTDLPS